MIWGSMRTSSCNLFDEGELSDVIVHQLLPSYHVAALSMVIRGIVGINIFCLPIFGF